MAPHAVLVCGPGFSHVSGCLLLAKALASTSAFSRLTIVCFARPYQDLFTTGRLPLPSDPSIHLEVLQDDIPEITSNPQRFAITPTMRENLQRLLQKLRHDHEPPATCLISDLIMGWTQSLADAVGLPRIDFWTATATSYNCLVSIPELISEELACCHTGPMPQTGWKTRAKVKIDCIPGMPGFFLEDVPRELRYSESSQETLVNAFYVGAQNARKAAGVLLSAVYDLEPKAFQALRQDIGITPYAIGPLLYHEAEPAVLDAATRSWLDSHAPSSVMYVSFGSHVRLRESELIELALGLQESGHPFLLVVRKDCTFEASRSLQQLLPDEFFSHVATHGHIVPWTSQRAVLHHTAVGGFLSHCGWNSTMESLWEGVPILACPRAAEQPTNGRLIVDTWGVGVELHTALDGSFSRQDVSAGVQSILVGDVGQRVRSKAQQLSKQIRDAPVKGGPSHASLLEFASTVGQQ